MISTASASLSPRLTAPSSTRAPTATSRLTPASESPPLPPHLPSPDRGDRENELIVQFLRHLFEPDKYPRPSDIDPITPSSDRTPPQPRSDQNPVLALAAPPPLPPTSRTAATTVTVAEMLRALVVVEDNKDKELLNAKGEVVDVVGLGMREESFADELRRTEGLKTEEELLRFLVGLDGKWGSSRKKRKFVDAMGFGMLSEGAGRCYWTEKEGAGGHRCIA